MSWKQDSSLLTLRSPTWFSTWLNTPGLNSAVAQSGGGPSGVGVLVTRHRSGRACAVELREY